MRKPIFKICLVNSVFLLEVIRGFQTLVVFMFAMSNFHKITCIFLHEISREKMESHEKTLNWNSISNDSKRLTPVCNTYISFSNRGNLKLTGGRKPDNMGRRTETNRSFTTLWLLSPSPKLPIQFFQWIRDINFRGHELSWRKKSDTLARGNHVRWHPPTWCYQWPCFQSYQTFWLIDCTEANQQYQLSLTFPTRAGWIQDFSSKVHEFRTGDFFNVFWCVSLAPHLRSMGGGAWYTAPTPRSLPFFSLTGIQYILWNNVYG